MPSTLLLTAAKQQAYRETFISCNSIHIASDVLIANLSKPYQFQWQSSLSCSSTTRQAEKTHSSYTETSYKKHSTSRLVICSKWLMAVVDEAVLAVACSHVQGSSSGVVTKKEMHCVQSPLRMFLVGAVSSWAHCRNAYMWSHSLYNSSKGATFFFSRCFCWLGFLTVSLSPSCVLLKCV